MSWEVVYKNLVQDSGSPATIYIALFNGDPQGAGSEITGATWARQSCSLGTASTGTVSNTANVVFTATGNQGSADYAAWYSASTGGTLYGGGALTATRSMVTGATLTFVTGAIDLTIA
jgi:hypothetical protein